MSTARAEFGTRYIPTTALPDNVKLGDCAVWCDSSSGTPRVKLRLPDGSDIDMIAAKTAMSSVPSNPFPLGQSGAYATPTGTLVGVAADGTTQTLTSGAFSATVIAASKYASLAAAVSALGSTVCELTIDQNFTLTGNLTIPGTMALRAGAGQITTTGFTLTINGAINAGPVQLFAGTGTVRFGRRPELYRPEWWGAVADGSTDCAPAINAAITSAMYDDGSYARAGVLKFSGGVYKCTAPITFPSNARRLELVGVGGFSIFTGSSNQRGATTLLYTGTGAGAFIQAAATNELRFRSLSVMYSSGSFTGHLLDMGNSASGLGGTHEVYDCCFGAQGASVWSANACISLGNAFGCKIELCFFGYASYGVLFRDSLTTASNANLVQSCWFGSLKVGGVANAGQACAVKSCVFEPNAVALGSPTMYPAYVNNLAGVSGTNYKCEALVISDCWMGDGDDSTWMVDFGASDVCDSGMISGNFIGGQIRMPAIMRHTVWTGNILGNQIGTGNIFTFSAGGTYVGNSVQYNGFLGGGTYYTNKPADGVNFVANDNHNGAVPSNSDYFKINGSTVLNGALTQSGGAVSITGNAASTIKTSSGDLKFDSAGQHQFYMAGTLALKILDLGSGACLVLPQVGSVSQIGNSSNPFLAAYINALISASVDSASAMTVGSTAPSVKVGKSGGSLGFFGASVAAQPSSAGNTATTAAGSTTTAFTNTTFTGGTGSTAYTIGDIVRALKLLGLIAS